jgi:hypothetical protein
LFAGIFLFGGRLAFQPGQRGRRRFLSFAGIAVGIVGSVNADTRHWYKARNLLARADPTWLSRLRRVRKA